MTHLILKNIQLMKSLGGLSLLEMQLIDFCLLQRAREQYRFQITDFFNEFGITVNHRQIERITPAFKKLFELKIPAQKERGKILYNFFDKVAMEVGTGWVEFQLNDYIQDVGLTRSTVTYDLSLAKKLKTKHAYNLFNLFSIQLEAEVTKEFLTYFLTGSEKEVNGSNIKQHYLKPAIEELEKELDWKIHLETTKHLRKVVGYVIKAEPIDRWKEWAKKELEGQVLDCLGFNLNLSDTIFRSLRGLDARAEAVEDLDKNTIWAEWLIDKENDKFLVETIVSMYNVHSKREA